MDNIVTLALEPLRNAARAEQFKRELDTAQRIVAEQNRLIAQLYSALLAARDSMTERHCRRGLDEVNAAIAAARGERT